MNRRILLLITLLARRRWHQPSEQSSRSRREHERADGMLKSQAGGHRQAGSGRGRLDPDMAQEKLVKGDFDKIAAVVPGASSTWTRQRKLGAVTGRSRTWTG